MTPVQVAITADDTSHKQVRHCHNILSKLIFPATQHQCALASNN